MSEAETPPEPSPRRGFLPPIGSVRYHLLLGAVAILVLGPLGGITAAYMNFSLGFFVGGQVLAGILGSVVTYGYGPDGKHGANFMQTMAASVASMAAMGVLIQAMVWLGLTIPPTWQLIVYFLCIGMFGVGVGMLYTPVLVDRLQLTYPSGLAVANILRALTDKRLLKRSVGQLGAGTGIGFLSGILSEKVAAIGALSFSASTLGAGMVVGARIGIPAITVGALGVGLTPWLRSHGYLGAEDPFRKVGFLVALGSIMGAAIVDLTLIFHSVYVRVLERAQEGLGPEDREIARRTQRFIAMGGILVVAASVFGIFVPVIGYGLAGVVALVLVVYRFVNPSPKRPPSKAPVAVADDWKTTNTRRLILWTGGWGLAVVVSAVTIMHLPPGYVIFAIALTFLFVMVNGISQGVSDSNPISSAFVVSVLLMAALGLRDPGVGLLSAAILLVSVSVACDMQQDRSTGWRLGSNRVVQFRYQVIGITMGAIMAVFMAKIFMKAYPALQIDTFTHPEQKVEQWQSAMTYKFVGALRGITSPNPTKTKLLLLGLGVGFVLELCRKLLKSNAAYRRFRDGSQTGFVVDFCVDALLLPSPYAASFGGFVDFTTSLWFGIGGIVSSVIQTMQEKAKAAAPKVAGEDDLPEDMSSTSLVGGGFIAGESLSALVLGILGLVALLK